jgi:hypothetical protein
LIELELSAELSLDKVNGGDGGDCMETDFALQL